jgi:hypothetical protein
MGSLFVQFDSREQKAGNIRHYKTKQHLMNRPVERVKAAGKRNACQQHVDPYPDRNHGPNGRAEEEWPESPGENGKVSTPACVL